MERNELINEVSWFGFNYGVFNREIAEDEVYERIEYILDDCEFLENFINIVYVYSKNTPNLDVDRTKTMLLELERVRLDLEYPSDTSGFPKRAFVKTR